MTRNPIHKPRKAGPQSRQGKRIQDIFGTPLKIYNPRRDAIRRAQQKARKNGATPEEINAAGRGRRLRRSHPGSIIPISSRTNPCGCITRNPPLSEEHWDVHSTPQFHETGSRLDDKGDGRSKKAGHEDYRGSFGSFAGSS